jgi:hypothetical protein
MTPFVKLSKWVMKLKFEIISTNQTGKNLLRISENTLNPSKRMTKQTNTLMTKLITWFLVRAEESEQIPR